MYVYMYIYIPCAINPIVLPMKVKQPCGHSSPPLVNFPPLNFPSF